MSDMHRLSHEIHILTAIILKTSRQSVEQCFSAQGIHLSMLQFGILRLLSHERYTLSELSRKMMLDPSTLVPALDALERKGYVRRERDMQDRRRFPLLLTDDGKIFLEQIQISQEDDLILKALTAMGPQDAELLRQLLHKVVAQLPEGQATLEEIQDRIRLHQESFDG